MEKIKSCVDCDYFNNGNCTRILYIFTSQYQKDYTFNPLAITERSEENSCNRDAKYFVPRRPWWKRLLRLK